MNDQSTRTDTTTDNTTTTTTTSTTTTTNTTTTSTNNNNTNDTETATSFLPKHNKDYGSKEYWERRFEKEPEFEWLVTYEQVSDQIRPLLASSDTSILVVGCGNCNFSADMYDDGFTNIVNIDYSENVISAMQERNAHRSRMTWKVMDMTDMSEFPDASFDVVIDKAAMDALLVNEGDLWNPEIGVIEKSHSMCQHISRILKQEQQQGGIFLQISFAQIHFRKKYLLGLHKQQQDEETTTTSLSSSLYCCPYEWDLTTESIGEKGSFLTHFLYIMKKEQKNSN